MERLIGQDFSDILTILLSYLDLREAIVLYYAYYERIDIPGHLLSLYWQPLSSSLVSLSFSLSLTRSVSYLSHLCDLNNFFQKCRNFQVISLHFTVGEEEEICQFLLKSLKQKSVETFEISLTLPESFSEETINLCHSYLEFLSSHKYSPLLQRLSVSIPHHRINSELLSLSSNLQHIFPNICEINGLEYYDPLMTEFFPQSEFHGFLDADNWPNLKILHIGNLIQRFFCCIEDFNQAHFLSHLDYIPLFLSKFTRTRFPSVITLDFDMIEDQQLLTFFSSLLEYEIENEECRNACDYIWPYITDIRLDRLCDECSHPFEIQENWNSQFRRLKEVRKDLKSINGPPVYVDGDRCVSNLSIKSLFDSAQSIQLFSSLPSLGLMSLFRSNLEPAGVKLKAFMDDQLFQQYLENPFLLPTNPWNSSPKITSLTIFERLSDCNGLQRQLSRERIEYPREFLRHQNKSYLDYLFEFIPYNEHQRYLPQIPRGPKNYDGLESFLINEESSSLEVLHVNESFLSKYESISDENENNRDVFENCTRLTKFILDFDLMWRSKYNPSKSVKSLQNFLLLIKNGKKKEKNNLKEIRLNFWSMEGYQRVEVVLSQFYSLRQNNIFSDLPEEDSVPVALYLRGMI